MRLNKKNVLNLLFLVFAALRLQNYFFPIPALKYFSAILLIGIVLVTIPTMGKGTRRVLFTLLGDLGSSLHGALFAALGENDKLLVGLGLVKNFVDDGHGK